MQDTKKRVESQFLDGIRNRLSLCKSIKYNSRSQRLEIPYYYLSGKTYKVGKGIDFVRYRNYKIGLPKYTSPSKKVVGDYYTPLYYPKQLIRDYNTNNLKSYSNTIVLTEGEFKSITACLCGIACISFAGITLHSHFTSFHQREFTQLIEAINARAVNIVLLYDADAVTIKNKQGEFTNKRLLDFQNSAINFYKLLRELPTKKKLKLFVGHVDHEKKGIDDLINSLDLKERKQCANELKDPGDKTNKKRYFNLLRLSSSNYKKQLNKMFPCRKLDYFINSNKEQLSKEHFTFYHTSETHKKTYPIRYYLQDISNGVMWAESAYYSEYTNKINSCIKSSQYIKYLSEKVEDIRNEIKINSRVLVQAPTGAGKTTLIEELKDSFERIILLTPTRAIAKQQKGYTLYIGGSHVSDNLKDTTDIVSTFAKVLQSGLINQNDFDNSLIVIDEAHEIYKSFAYRSAECAMLEYLVRQFNNVLCLSATACFPFFYSLDFSLMTYTQSVPRVKPLSVLLYSDRVTKNGKVDYKKLILGVIKETRERGRKAYIFNLSKDNHLINEIHETDTKSMLITGDTSRNKYKELFNSILNKERVFIGEYDVFLTNSVLEAGASFYDTDIDIHIIGSTDESQIIQALSRFRSLEGNRFFLYTRKKDFKSNTDSPQHNLKELEYECNLDKYTSFGRGDIRSSLDAEIKTFKSSFSYAKTFFELEQNRISSQNIWQLLGCLSKSTQIKITSIDVIEPPRVHKDVLPSEIKKDFLLKNGIIQERNISIAIKSIKDKRTINSLCKFDKGFDYFFDNDIDSIPLEIKKNELYLLKLIVFCKDISIKLNMIDVNVEKCFNEIVSHFKDDVLSNYKLIESTILFFALKEKPNSIQQLNNKGKAIAYKKLIELANKKNSVLNTYDLKKEKGFNRLNRNQRLFYVKIVSLYAKILSILIAKSKDSPEKDDIKIDSPEKDDIDDLYNTPYKTIRKKKEYLKRDTKTQQSI